MKPSLFIGPMSRNVVDACIEYANDTTTPLGLIPSRRQIDMNSGYVDETWTTSTFAKYVRGRSERIVLQRDHGGPWQGDMDDFGLASLSYDAKHLDLLHVDPFKKYPDLWAAASYTAYVMEDLADSGCRFEIGTEEAIRPMTVDECRKFFSLVRDRVRDGLDRVEYLIVQFGTKIVGGRNTGEFDPEKAERMISLCAEFNKMSKEHNGDYLSVEEVRKRRAMGLDALNVAPEMGGIESGCLLEALSERDDLMDRFFWLSVESNRWQKWFPKNFDPRTDREGVVRACGHYCFSDPEFRDLILEIDYQEVVDRAKSRMKERIKELS